MSPTSLIPLFLVLYALFASFIRNRLHMERAPYRPPVWHYRWTSCSWLAYTYRLRCYWLRRQKRCWRMGMGRRDLAGGNRVIVGIQVFAVGIELPKFYMGRHWRSVAMMLGPVMTFGWIVCSLLVYWLFKTDFRTALVVAACLTPTDPVLAASIIGNSQFSSRVPKRIKHMLSAEAGCNDEISFPFLSLLCAFGILLGMVIGITSNYVLRFSTNRKYIDEAGFTVFYLLLAVFSVGCASILDGWFTKRTQKTHFPSIIDLLPQQRNVRISGSCHSMAPFSPTSITESVTPGRLVAFLVLVLLFRRIPIVLQRGNGTPDIHTWTEALFCGHSAPWASAGLFLAIEARADLETGGSTPLSHPPAYLHPYTDKEKAIMIILADRRLRGVRKATRAWLECVGTSLASHFTRDKEHRAGLLAAETEPLKAWSMVLEMAKASLKMRAIWRTRSL
ncbi:hypothetical protein Q7P35_009765 [Cladosporium inversicolor]